MHDEFLRGVEKRLQDSWAVYQGPADALVLAGIISERQIPGTNGNPRGLCVFEPAGDIRKSKMGPCVAGTLRIVAKKCFGRLIYEVWQRLDQDRAAAEAEEARARAAWPFATVYGSVPA